MCSLKGLTLIAAGDVGRRLLLVHSVTLKHAGTQASPDDVYVTHTS